MTNPTDPLNQPIPPDVLAEVKTACSDTDPQESGCRTCGHSGMQHDLGDQGLSICCVVGCDCGWFHDGLDYTANKPPTRESADSSSDKNTTVTVTGQGERDVLRKKIDVWFQRMDRDEPGISSWDRMVREHIDADRATIERLGNELADSKMQTAAKEELLDLLRRGHE